MLRLNGLKLKKVRCLIFALLNSLTIFIPLLIDQIISQAFAPGQLYANIRIFFLYFRNPLWMLCCHFFALKILKLKVSQTVYLLLPAFCFSQIYVLFSGVLEPITLMFAEGNEKLILTLYFAWQIVTCISHLVIVVFFVRYIQHHENRFRVEFTAEDTIYRKKITYFYLQMTLIWIGLSTMILLQSYFPNWANMMMMLTLITFVIMIIVLNINSIFQKTATENSNAHLDVITANVDEFRKTKHEFYNILHTYEGYFQLKKYDELESFHKKLFTQTAASVSGLDIPKLKVRPAIYGVFLNLSEKAKTAAINLHFYHLEGLEQVNMDDYNFCRALTILLNNAVEHASETEEKIISVFVKYIKNDEGLIVIENSASQAVDMQRLFVKGYTTKANHMGRGLFDLKKILSSYSGFGVTADQNDKTFIVYFKVRFMPGSDE